MAGRNTIQILRGSSTFNPKNSNEVLLDGQPFYSKQTHRLYIGDGVTELKKLSASNIFASTNEITTNLRNSIGSYSVALLSDNTATQARAEAKKSVAFGAAIIDGDSTGAVAFGDTKIRGGSIYSFATGGYQADNVIGCFNENGIDYFYSVPNSTIIAGKGNRCTQSNQLVAGIFNKPLRNARFIVGGGNANKRKNDLVLLDNSSLLIGGLRYDYSGLSKEQQAKAKDHNVAGQQSLAVGCGQTITHAFSFAANKDNETYQRGAVAFGGSNQAGFKEQTTYTEGGLIEALGFDDFYWSADKGEAQNGGGKNDAGKIIDKNGYVYGDSYSFAFVSGEGNKALARGTFIGGGVNSVADGWRSAIIGGEQHQVHASKSFVGGGHYNCVQSEGEQSAIVGGNTNGICSARAFIGGGVNNTIYTESNGTAIIGGSQNIIKSTAALSCILGGSSNEVQEGAGSSIVAGTSNRASKKDQVVFGHYNDYTKQDAAFMVGNGSSSSNRGNAITVFFNGRIVGGRETQSTDSNFTLVTKGYVDNIKNNVNNIVNNYVSDGQLDQRLSNQYADIMEVIDNRLGSSSSHYTYSQSDGTLYIHW